MRTRLLAAGLVALCLTTAAAARADEQSDLEKGRAAYFAKNYEDADQRFRAMLDPQHGTLHDPLLIAEARMYWGATMLAENRLDDASRMFERLILDNPDYEPDPFRLPQDVINFFIDVRAKLREKLRAQREKELEEKLAREKHEKEEKERQARYLKALEAQASAVPVIEQHSRLLALAPFGLGQFQNGDKALGWTFLVAESAFALAGLVAVPIYLIEVANGADEYQTYGESHRAQFEAYRSRANAWRAVNLVSVGAFALTYVAGVLQAEAAFVPSRTQTQPRALPTVGLAPTIAPVTAPESAAPRGAVVGITGSF